MSLTDSNIWQALQRHQQETAQVKMTDQFAEHSERAEDFSVEAAGLFLDYSKNRIDQKTLDLLTELSESRHLPQALEALFSGEHVNVTEDRPAWHSALRQPVHESTRVTELVQENVVKMHHIVSELRGQTWLGFSGQPITDIVNIGIGGSDLGPMLAIQALKGAEKQPLRCHLVSSLDAAQMSDLLPTLNPATTLFIVVSKSFTTRETLVNADMAKAWLCDAVESSEALKNHFIAVSTNVTAVEAWGIHSDHILPMWDWVGGRFSLWSTVGLVIALAYGMTTFESLLAGAHAMDTHTRNAPLQQNMPVILAWLSIWYGNFYGAQTHAVIPYSYRLRSLPAYLQQLFMESLGKSVDDAGNTLDYATGGIIWGGVGTDSQHSFHQLLMQGNQFTPIDFILPIYTREKGDCRDLVTNCLAQSHAMMTGLHDDQLPIYKRVAGNVPSNTIVMDQLTPASLGALLALYEHKVYVQSVIWGIDAFDQWGVELGKSIARSMAKGGAGSLDLSHDGSTAQLIERCL